LIRLSDRLAGRNGSIYQAYILGTTQEELAARHGIHQTRVAQIIAEVRASIPEEDLAAARSDHLDVLRRLTAVAAEIMEAPLPPAYSNGRPIVDENGEYVRDAGPRLAALDRIVKATERMAKVLGLDAPVKADVTVSDQADRVAEAAAAEALARMATDTSE
jgi:hypothetical protein